VALSGVTVRLSTSALRSDADKSTLNYPWRQNFSLIDLHPDSPSAAREIHPILRWSMRMVPAMVFLFGLPLDNVNI
jgi:hypothetical protein